MVIDITQYKVKNVETKKTPKKSSGKLSAHSTEVKVFRSKKKPNAIEKALRRSEQLAW